MFTAYVVVAIVAAAANLAFAAMDFTHSKWVLANMTNVAIPHSWVNPLGTVKAVGAAGLLVGIGVRSLGVAAAVGLVLFFVGAVITHRRARVGGYHYPGAFLMLAVASLVLRLSSS